MSEKELVQFCSEGYVKAFLAYKPSSYNFSIYDLRISLSAILIYHKQPQASTDNMINTLVLIQ